MKVAGKRVVVTGGASGIGEASVRRFALEGAQVAFVDRDAERGRSISAELSEAGTPVAFMDGDAADPGFIEAATGQLADALGGIDVLHNNAGMVAGADALGTDVADWDRVHALNVRAPWLWSRACIPHMRAAGGGAIVFTGSTSGMVGYPGVIAYTSSKGGLMNLTRSLALELAPEGITVNTVSPGHIDTPMTRGFFTDPDDAGALERNLAAHAATVPVKRLGLPEEVAAFVVFLASDDARFCTGGIHVCDGGITAE
jgi:NAD(P)-dependent dehydrogenase (short-subunit alcohol dehydrogenase family)